MTKFNEPLLFDTYLRPQIWGGDGLARLLGKRSQNPSIPGEADRLTEPLLFGEAWELSTLPEHVSRVVSGPSHEKSLAEIWRQSSAAMPKSDGACGEFPWLVKWLDCHGGLSLQVHPDDEAARTLLGQSRGKSEAWIVVGVEPHARISTGLLDGVTREDFESHLATGTVEKRLHSFEPRVGDCLSLPAGTVHTARGVMLAEIQQPSDATFRLFDWNRRDPSGRSRPLHREWGLNAIDWQQGPVAPIVSTPLALVGEGISGEALLETDWVRLERFTVTRPWTTTRTGVLTVWMILAGNAVLLDVSNGTRYELSCGATVLIPGEVGSIEWSPSSADQSCTLLSIGQARLR